MAYLRYGLIAVLLSAAFGGTVMASPIHMQDGNAPKLGDSLTLEQLQLLDARPDNGWHLGWFKKERGAVLPDDVFLYSSLETVVIHNAFATGDVAATAILLGSEPALAREMSNALDSSAQVTSMPEPTTLVLLGSGVVAGVVRRRLLEKQRQHR